MKAKDLLYRGCLLAAALIWGIAFVVMKTTLDHVPVAYLLMIRFLGGALVLSLVFFKKLKKTNKKYILGGLVSGTLLFLAYYIQTVGLHHTTPGKNAFLTASYCVIVPFLGWIVFHRKPDRSNIAAAVLCVVGVGLVSLTSDLTMGLGDLLTFISAIFFAAHMLALEHFTKKLDPVLLTIIQFAFTGIYSLLVGLCTETFPASFSTDAIISLAYLCVLSTAVALLLQTLGQKGTPASSACLIMSLEAVFGVLTSVIFYHEEVSGRMWLGFVLIFAAIIISETKLLNRHKSEDEDTLQVSSAKAGG